MERIRKYIDSVFAEPGKESLITGTMRFLLAEDLLSDQDMLIAHHPRPDPFESVFPAGAEINPDQLRAELQNVKRTPAFLDAYMTDQGTRIYLLSDEYRSKTGYILRTRRKVPREAMDILSVWNRLQHYSDRTSIRTREEAEDRFANYISQIIHDSQSLLHLGQDVEATPELEARFHYQEISNQNILFFIRQPDIFKIPVRAEHFISDSLDLIGVNAEDLRLEIPGNLPEITIDLELMSRALNEIVKNAIEATKGDLSRLIIRIELQESGSPLHDFRWLKIKIEDKGYGITDDFIIQSDRPFFTTRKEQGATGFGLTLARKIAEAHGGALNIHSREGRGTKVTIFIPQETT